MSIKNKKGFTLIELVAVLVIMAILALIVTPLVMSIIKKARVSADKRSIDAYGRSVELAIANYLLDNGDFPDSISDLTIEYSGDQVECSTAQINTDSSVYLTGCTVAGRSVDYAYGKEGQITYKSYSVGDEVKYNNVDYYVIKNSGIDDSTVTVLKAEPLTVAEVNSYGGKWNYTSSESWNYNNSGYGAIIYYGSDRCYTDPANSRGPSDGCINNFESSHVKQVIDLWALDNFNEGDLVEDGMGYSARLLTYDEYSIYLHSEEETTYTISNDPIINTKYVVDYDWLYSNNYSYWTMSPYQDSLDKVWTVSNNGNLDNFEVTLVSVVRPVVTIKKSALTD